LISIPKWSDFSLLEGSLTPMPMNISIPKWSDFSPWNQENKVAVSQISIPKWSDFSHNKSLTLLSHHRNFNPKMV